MSIIRGSSIRTFVWIWMVALAFSGLARGTQSSKGANATVSGLWILQSDGEYYGALTLEQDGEKLTGHMRGGRLEGSLKGNTIHFLNKSKGYTEEVSGTVQGASMTGTVVLTPVQPQTADAARPVTVPFTADFVPRPGPPQLHDFVPESFSFYFSSEIKPVLTLWPGDRVHTTTLDAGGYDGKGAKRTRGGNPQTGPFYVETAAPGDTLAVHLTRLTLNRDWAESDDSMVPWALNTALAVKMNYGEKAVRWHLDKEHGIATPENPDEHLTHYSIPLHPMLGCVAVAELPWRDIPNTNDSGSYGGNMDFNEIVEGTTVYLPVNVPGALLYVGDGHATQGDGELNGNALETSMDVDFSVDVIPNDGNPVSGPRIESATHLMAMGLAGSLDDAFRIATENMVQWLTAKYELTPSEISQILGTAAEYEINEVADPKVGVVLKIDKEALRPLPQPRQ